MMPRRSPSCDGTYCEPTATGWSHSEDCLSLQTDDSAVVDDATAAANEDGYARPFIPAQQNRRWAA